MKNLFLFTGQETYLLQEQIRSWRAAFQEKYGQMNLDIMDADEVALNDIMAATIAMPFLGDKRLIFIHNLPDAPKTKNPDEVTEKDDRRSEELKKLEDHLDSIPESSVVVFVQPNPDKRRALYKKLAAVAEVKDFAPLQGQAIIQWVQIKAKSLGVTVDAVTAEYLITLTGHDLWRLSSELSKISSYKPGEKITQETIDSLVTPTLEANVFHLTDALGAKNPKRAMQSLHRNVAAGENLRQVFYMIVRQFRLLLQGDGFLEASPGANAAIFASRLKIHPFVAKNTLAQLKHFKRAELKQAYERLLEIDTALKTSRIKVTVDNQDELTLAIERFIINFCS